MRDKPLILIVDDEPAFQEIISVKLSASGFEPVVAHNAEEGFDAAKKLHPDLILMDIHMPGETGTDAALRIRQCPQTSSIKIAFLSNLKDPWPQTRASRNELAKMLGMDDFIDKSVDLDVIVNSVKNIVSR